MLDGRATPTQLPSRDRKGADRLLTRAARTQRAPSCRGFTLIELLIAAFISMAVFLVGFITINGTIRARGEATSSLRATENARLFFQTLERDMAAAWRGPFNMQKGLANPADQTVNIPAGGGTAPMPSPIVPIVVTLEAGGTPLTDVLQFYTRSDMPAAATGTPERRVFVRYYANPNEHTLCRQVTEDATTPPSQIEGSFEIKGDRPDTNAMFEDVKQLVVVHRKWIEGTKSFFPPLNAQRETGLNVGDPLPSDCTHLVVKLIMFDRFAEERLSATDKLDTNGMPMIRSYRTFVRVIPIPHTFE